MTKAKRVKRWDQPGFSDGFTIGTLWVAENALVRLLGSHYRRRPEGHYIIEAHRAVEAAIQIVRKRAQAKV